MPSALRLLIAQINPTVGAIEQNAQLILEIIELQAKHHDLILFPELALCGYPPEDLLFNLDFHQAIQTQLNRIKLASQECHVVIGHPELRHDHCFNAVSIFFAGKQLAHYHKQALPNYGVFDEKRYFTPGEKRACVLTVKGQRLGICICEDLWAEEPIKQLQHADVQGILSLNASPFELGKYEKRLSLLKQIAKKGFFIAYANLVGGQDELVFDGQSLLIDAQAQVHTCLPAFETAIQSVILPSATSIAPQSDPITQCYQALCLALKDYVRKNGFQKVILGLSGGIDSALTLAIAVDALGSENVLALKLPSRYTSAMSLEDATLELEALNVASHTLSIEPAYEALLNTLEPITNNSNGIWTENIQARIRGLLLMAVSNQHGHLLLCTTNKSELAMGYGTLYGDMAGGFALLKDVLKTQVYALARYRNRISKVIPERVLTRAPSAELAHDQTDQDSLPPYDVLDPILEAYLRQDSLTAFNPEDVDLVLKRIEHHEYKRRQAPIGPKISHRAFGRDWRMPVSGEGAF